VPSALGAPAERRGAESNTSGVNFWALTVIMLMLVEEGRRRVKHQGMVDVRRGYTRLRREAGGPASHLPLWVFIFSTSSRILKFNM
jgi:hypothetical protein